MKIWMNGYGEQMMTWERGDKAMFQSAKYPDLTPYEVTISRIYSENQNGHPAYLGHVEEDGWHPYECYSPKAAS